MKTKTLRNFCLILLGALCMHCAPEKSAQVTVVEDYNPFLMDQKIDTVSKAFNLWNGKITKDSTELMSFGRVAAAYTSFFKQSGNITFLKKAEACLSKAVAIANINKEGYLRSLARNYISQHRFKEALDLAERATALGGGKKKSHALLFDVHMELGNYGKAKNYLDSITAPSDFGYLIRVAKWNDYKGDLATTIRLMEKALQKAEASKNRDLMVWAYSNIADYYGHAGELQMSYDHYLKTLELDPTNAYAKKGIAWIVFSHERNGVEAMRILNSITAYHKAPDNFLLGLEIADFLGDKSAAAHYMDRYANAVSDPNYGVMYNAYNVPLWIANNEKPEKYLDVALLEVENRPTPEAYGLLASAYLASGQQEKAQDLVATYIDGKTFEPAVLMTAAQVYKANKLYEKVRPLKEELAGAIYELGPGAMTTINSL